MSSEVQEFLEKQFKETHYSITKKDSKDILLEENDIEIDHSDLFVKGQLKGKEFVKERKV